MIDIRGKKEEEQNKVSIQMPEYIDVYAGNTIRLNATSNGGVDIKTLYMESQNTSIATICNSYIIANNVGNTEIITKVADGDETYEFTTKVTVKAGKLSVTPDIKKISIGETVRFKAMISCGVFKSVSYQSTSLKTAIVKQEGIYGFVTGVAKGDVNIIVTVNVGNKIQEKIITLIVDPAKDNFIPISNPVNGIDYTEENEWKGSRVFFGRYEQDNNINNGKEPILWRVLEVKDDTILLLSEYGLICKFYNDTYDSVTWETSTIRDWLNSTFLNKAFLKSEMDAISDTLLKTNNNKKFGSVGGNKTIDRVFLLSNKDVNNTAYGFQKGSRNKSKTRTVQITKHALVEGYLNKTNNNTCWWLRSPGINNYYAAYILTTGRLTYGYFVGRRNDAIRPAIRVKRSSIMFGDEISDGKYKCPMIIAKD